MEGVFLYRLSPKHPVDSVAIERRVYLEEVTDTGANVLRQDIKIVPAVDNFRSHCRYDPTGTWSVPPHAL
jgi:hypothetical protein